MSSSFERKEIVILAVDAGNICYYEILAENDAMNVACYFEFLKERVESWDGNRKHTAWLLEGNALPHRPSEVSQNIFGVGCNTVTFLI